MPLFRDLRIRDIGSHRWQPLCRLKRRIRETSRQLRRDGDAVEDGDDLLRQVFDASYRRLIGQMYVLCGDLVEAEDVVQEAFARAVTHRRSFEMLDNPEAWLRVTSVNLLRSRHRRRVLADRVRLQAVESRRPRHPPDLTEDRIALLAALRRLPAGQREAIALHYLADLPVAEVARTLEVPVGTIKARLSRGRAALATLLTDRDHPSTAEVPHA